MNAADKDTLISLLDERIRQISREVVEERQTKELEASGLSVNDHEVHKLSESLRRIMAKEFVSIREVALLLNCSDGHVRNLVSKAHHGKASNPIPHLDLDGVTVFPRVKLLEWAEQPKRKLRAVS